MDDSVKRRRRIAIAALGGLAAGAFAFGVALGDGTPAEESAASKLTLPQLAGQRLVVGFEGTTPPAPVRRLIRRGRLAGPRPGAWWRACRRSRARPACGSRCW
jgi:hypothetical protein